VFWCCVWCLTKYRRVFYLSLVFCYLVFLTFLFLFFCLFASVLVAQSQWRLPAICTQERRISCRMVRVSVTLSQVFGLLDFGLVLKPSLLGFVVSVAVKFGGEGDFIWVCQPLRALQDQAYVVEPRLGQRMS